MIKRSPTYSEKKRNSNIWNRSKSKRHSMLVPDQFSADMLKLQENAETVSEIGPDSVQQGNAGRKGFDEQIREIGEDEGDSLTLRSADQFEDSSEMLNSAFNDYQLALQALSIDSSSRNIQEQSEADTATTNTIPAPASTDIETKSREQCKTKAVTISSAPIHDAKTMTIPRIPTYDAPILEVRTISKFVFVGYKESSSNELDATDNHRDSYFADNGFFDDTRLIFEESEDDEKIKRTSFTL
ncbi:unnamed protein product [Kuraishia capsulata CBS 1993]|uniref:Uncharacterized protein n=1 Tax=Kuraishia capsulata CBS 1993 TaxID=1382522 RepID=W6MVR9_9ASCO|nr:uncharacterized protein KUCA_T00002422001 [Kuraishia capsulata CBS 1993]CDK26450.1 unnamed protein product [Kuraishia capsulata CBS 1993]